MTTVMRAQDLLAAREWIDDVFGDEVDAFALQPLAVARVIRRNYEGGISQFIADGGN